MTERPLVYCDKCHSLCDKLISVPMVTQDKLYHFTDTNTTGKPIEFRGKDHWQKHLKRLRLHDDIPQRPIKESDFKKVDNSYEKNKKREETKKILTEVYKEVKQKGNK